ncbi:MAG: hypothetical protein EoVTN8_613 [Fluviibacter phosphoraccumulans EoVTN8]
MNITAKEYQTLLRSNFVTFIERSFYELNPQTRLLLAPYIHLIAMHLEACRLGRIKRLIINLLPCYLKSHCASVAFPVWLLGQDPSARIICAFYGQDLADNLALESRKILQSAFYQQTFATRLDPRKMAVDDFDRRRRPHGNLCGWRPDRSRGRLPRGGDFLIIDDPMKPDEALSDTRRQTVNDWFDGTLLSRLNDKVNGCIIIIMQRLHQDDLVGHALEHGDWTVLNLPAIAEEDETFDIMDIFGQRIWKREMGTPLHEARETVEMLKATKARIGEYNFSSQYQQNPIPLGGAMIKSGGLMNYETFPPMGECQYVVQSWDTANKSGELNAWSVCTTWGIWNERYYLMDVYRKRLDYPDLLKSVVELSDRFKPRKIVIEDKASSTQLIQDLKYRGITTIHEYQPPSGTDKIMRLHAQTDVFEQGLVYLPKQAPWLDEYRTELLGFPGSKFYDQVDSTAHAIDFIKTNYRRNLAVWAKLGE